MDTLQFITCGSVDDGKSTLIGRLLFDTKAIQEDQEEKLAKDSFKYGTQGQELDFSLLVDGLAAEREQQITIDVAYRYFQTDVRKFIIADCPGHEQYTRNMVTGASNADLAIILVDARKGMLPQTRRHTRVVDLLAVPNIVLAVSKMDLVDYDEGVFNKNVLQFMEFAGELDAQDVTHIPISGLKGENVTRSSEKTPWYPGPTLLEHLETVAIKNMHQSSASFCMPVQLVNRPNSDFRGYSGSILQGTVSPGDKVCIMPSRMESHIDRIVSFDGDLDKASAGQAVTLTFEDEIDCSRGNTIVASNSSIQTADQFDATIIWMDEVPLAPGREYLLKIGTQTVRATVGVPKFEEDINTKNHLSVKTLTFNSIGNSVVTTNGQITFEPFRDARNLGGLYFNRPRRQ